MIALQRNRTQVPRSFQRIKREARELKLLSDFCAGTLTYTSVPWKSVKGQLRTETAGKCAYCEAPTAIVAHGDVEHIRPKSVYWWLSMCYDNYLYSCQICNQMYKKDRFPVSGNRLTAPPARPGMTPVHLLALVGTFAPDPQDLGASLTVAAYQAAAARERPQLLDPYTDDPEPFFGYRHDAVTRLVRVVPRGRGARRRRAQTSIELYGLNREELMLDRWKEHEIARSAYDVLRLAPGASRARDILKVMMRSDHRYAGMVRYYVRVRWRLGL